MASVIRIANIACALNMPYISEQLGLAESQYIGVIVCFISLLSGIMVAYMDKYRAESDSAENNREREGKIFGNLMETWVGFSYV